MVAVVIVPGAALANVTDKDRTAFNACRLEATNSKFNAERAISACRSGRTYFLRRMSEEVGENREQMQYSVAFCRELEGIGEVALGETQLGEAHLLLAAVDYRLLMEQSVDESLVDSAKRELEYIHNALSEFHPVG